MKTEKPPRGWTKRHWELSQNAVQLAVIIERERCARIVCPHEPGHPALVCCQKKKEIRGS